jgi:DnaJ-class molecular chaperone
MKHTKLVEVPTTCLNCGGRGIVGKHHVTNKRNKQKCPVCKGTGETKRNEEREVYS